MVVADGCTTWVVGTEVIGADPVGSDDGANDTLGPIVDGIGSLGIIDVAGSLGPVLGITDVVCTLWPTYDEIGSLGTVDTD